MKQDLRGYTSLLAHYLSPQRGMVGLLALVLLATTAVQLVNPQLLRSFVDVLTAGEGVAQAVKIGFSFVGLALVQQGLVLGSVYLSEQVGWTATNALREDLVRHCLQLDMSFHTSRTPGEMIERIDGDVNALSNFFSQFTIQIFSNLLVVIGMLGMLFATDWRAGLTMSAVTFITAFAIARMGSLTTPLWEKERQKSAELFGFLEERLNGTEDIRANGAGPYVLRRFYQLSRTLMQAAVKAALMFNLLINSGFLLFALAVAAGMAISAYLYLSGAITLGTAVMIVFLANMIENPLWRLTNQLQDLQRAAASINRVGQFFKIESKIQEQDANLKGCLPKGPLAVEFQNVSFRYTDDSPKVIHDFSMELQPGCVLGVLGRTGSGKTTLARLLFRLYEVNEGCIRLGERDLRSFPTGELRQSVGMVSQNIQLFHATLRDNLTFFNSGIDEKQLVEVIENLGLGPWLKSLTNGLDTMLESGGGGVSAGEAQLLAFARIFLKHPGLVILDEATARLDPVTEALIERAVEQLTRQATTIIIAHRLSTVEKASHILVLEDGKVVEFGERSALKADPASRFSHLLSTGLEEVLA
jgi:ATP-binding cassette, subfamily B, bacterial